MDSSFLGMTVFCLLTLLLLFVCSHLRMKVYRLQQDVPYKEAWVQLYNVFGERMQSEEQELMDSVLQSVKLDLEEQQNAIQNQAPDKV